MPLRLKLFYQSPRNIFEDRFFAVWTLPTVPYIGLQISHWTPHWVFIWLARFWYSRKGNTAACLEIDVLTYVFCKFVWYSHRSSYTILPTIQPRQGIYQNLCAWSPPSVMIFLIAIPPTGCHSVVNYIWFTHLNGAIDAAYSCLDTWFSFLIFGSMYEIVVGHRQRLDLISKLTWYNIDVRQMWRCWLGCF